MLKLCYTDLFKTAKSLLTWILFPVGWYNCSLIKVQSWLKTGVGLTIKFQTHLQENNSDPFLLALSLSTSQATITTTSASHKTNLF